MSNRFSYIKYDEQSMKDQKLLKDCFEGIEGIIDALPNGRAKSLVYVALEEAYMWCGKAIRDAQIARTGSAVEQPERGNE